MTTLTPVLPLAAFEAAAGGLAARLQTHVVVVRSRAGGGSGTIWTDDGLIITNSHVVPGDAAEIITEDDRGRAARVVARDQERDLAALRVTAEALPPATVGDSAALRPGQLVFAVGNPWGQRGALTAGIIFSVGGAAAENRVPLDDVIRADVRLAPGNSGGPLADAAGRVIGINSMIAGGMAVAIPSNTVARFVAGDVPGQAFLGVQAQPVAAPAPAGQVAGLMLTDVVADSPAERAGLLPGDVLLSLDGVTGVSAIVRRLRRIRVGTPVRLALIRGAAAHTIEVTPVARVP